MNENAHKASLQSHMAHVEHTSASELLDTEQGIWATKVTLFALVIITVVEAAIAFLSGSAALLADTLHSLSNAASTVPLWFAFVLSRRRASQSYPYGYHRAQDVAGIVILLIIAASAVLVGFQSVRKLISVDEPGFIPLAMAAGAVAFLGNEAIAQFRVRVGKRIGSAALVADGHHARADALGSLAVVLGLAAVVLGFPIGDPIVGLLITALIVYILVREAGPQILARVMDRIDPHVLTDIQRVTLEVPQVQEVYEVRARWIGHILLAELSISVDLGLSVGQGHEAAEAVEHTLLHRLPKLHRSVVHVEPAGEERRLPHTLTAHHLTEEPTQE